MHVGGNQRRPFQPKEGKTGKSAVNLRKTAENLRASAEDNRVDAAREAFASRTYDTLGDDYNPDMAERYAKSFRRMKKRARNKESAAHKMENAANQM